METLLAVAGLITVGAITPGPNNLIVLRTAAKGGFPDALPAVAGIVLGGLGLLLLVAAGGAILFQLLPGLRLALALAGSMYLVWLGFRLIAGSFGPKQDDESGLRLPAGLAGLAAFQLLNPKSWVLVLTAVAAMPPSSPLVLLQLAGLFVVIPATCLLLWSSCGALMMRALANGSISSWFDRVMGGTLAASAAALVVAA
jgi:threonine/homoserine/homoserine lactone efflux protein